MKRNPLTRQIVLDQALQMASEQGFSQVTYNGLARELGVQPQSLYRYVVNIADVKAGVVAEYIKHLIVSLHKKLLPYSGKEALRQFAIHFISYGQTSIPFAEMISGLTEYGHTPQVVEQLMDLRKISVTIISSITSGPDDVNENEELFLNFIIGNLALVTMGSLEVIHDQKIFMENVDRVLTLIK
ncbi:TetR/AcrR family transcriptional regulator [Loigolactobacillus iwatensis]|uniref:TetR/AcrR family transcriptional regulator n=1 Tax=Loigolactobacillus iwatensis TaxID=1267156 RepID=UPI000F7F9FDA|nr:TetR/AcrR family transcriptional regulator [Loigolactobacillus iwatensis]